MLKRLLLFAALGGIPAIAADIRAANCTQSTVQAAITSAVNGDRVIVPGNCSVSWTNLTIPNTKGISLMADGNVTLTADSSIACTAPTNNAQATRIAGFKFTNPGNTNTGVLACDSTPTSGTYRIDHNTFITTGAAATYIATGGNGPGIIDHNYLQADAPSEMIHNFGLGASNAGGWTTDLTPGSANAVYVEDNIFTYPGAGTNPEYFFGTSAVQSYYGARTVVRYNRMNMVQVDQHGTGGNIGARWWEIYENTFDTSLPNANQSDYIVTRAGSGVIFNNHHIGSNLGGGNITLYEEDTGYPALYQVGRGYNETYSPAYVWNNDGTMNVASGSANVQLSRDFFSSGSQPSPMLRCQSAADGGTSGGSTCPTTYSYTPYTYPHPLVTGFTRTVCASNCNYTNYNAADTDTQNVWCGDTVYLKAGAGTGNGSVTPTGWHTGGGNLSANNPLTITRACSAALPITITTDQETKLPPAGVRVDFSYINGTNPILPVVFNPAQGLVFSTKVGNGGAPASGYVIRGVAFCCGAGGNSDYVDAGARGGGTDDSQLNLKSDLGHDIIFDRVLIINDPFQQVGRCFTGNAVNLNLINSYIDCGDKRGQDSQAITSYTGEHVAIFNNFFNGITESFSFSGAMSAVYTPKISTATLLSNSSVSTVQIPNDWDIGYNEITHPNWVFMQKWTANTAVPRGKLFTPSTGGTTRLQAQTAGVTCGTEPTWPGSINGTVTEACGGGVTWRRDDPTNTQQVKNLFECKTCDTIKIHHNSLHHNWTNAGQSAAFTLTSSPSSGPEEKVTNITIQNNLISKIGFFLNTSGMDIGNDFNNIPSIMTNNGPWNFTGSNNSLTVTVAGSHVIGPITLTTGSARTANQVATQVQTAMTTAGFGLACEDGLGAILFRGTISGEVNCNQMNSNYVIGNSSLSFSGTAATVLGVNGKTSNGCTKPRDNTFFGCGSAGNWNITNNMIGPFNTAQMWDYQNYIVAISQHIHDVVLGHNTLFGNSLAQGASEVNGPGPNIGAMFRPTGGDGALLDKYPPYNIVIKDNVIKWLDTNLTGQNYCNNGNMIAFTCVNYYFGQPTFVNTGTPVPTDATASAGTFSFNILPGALLHGSTTRSTTPSPDFGGTNNSPFNYPSDNYNTSSPTLDGQTGQILSPPGPASDGSILGADAPTIPRILDARIKVSDRAAVFTYETTGPIAYNSSYFCAALVTTKDSKDFNSIKGEDSYFAPPVADADPSLYQNPMWERNDAFVTSGLQRSIVIGLNTALPVSTDGYVRLPCPGAQWPEDWPSTKFTTLATQSGTTTLTFTRTPAVAIGAITTMKVLYGTGYSRASGTISGGSSATASCTAGSSCSVSVSSIAVGAPLYAKVQFLDVSNNVLATDQMNPPILPLNNIVDDPTAFPIPGVYASTQSVYLATTTPSSTIRYTTDGSTPACPSTGTLYSGAISVSSDTTITAIGCQGGFTSSSVITAVFFFRSSTAAPAYLPVAGTYGSAQNVAITSSTTGSQIRYTLDGTVPTSTSGIPYFGPVNIAMSGTLKAVAFSPGLAENLTTGSFIIGSVVADPTFSPTPGSYPSAQTVTISTATGGATIRYTTNGVAPTSSSGTVYSGPVTITTTTTLKAIAYESGFTDSNVTSGVYTITPLVAAPASLRGVTSVTNVNAVSH